MSFFLSLSLPVCNPIYQSVSLSLSLRLFLLSLSLSPLFYSVTLSLSLLSSLFYSLSLLSFTLLLSLSLLSSLFYSLSFSFSLCISLSLSLILSLSVSLFRNYQTTSDESGLIIVWMMHNGMWYVPNLSHFSYHHRFLIFHFHSISKSQFVIVKGR